MFSLEISLLLNGIVEEPVKLVGVARALKCEIEIVHGAAVALNYFAYNFIKIHRTLRA